MQVRERWMNEVAVIDVAGSVTGGHPSPLKEAVGKLVRLGVRRIILNLREVTYLDSAGLGELVSCYTRATHSDATIVLTDVGPRVHELLEMTNILTIFDIFDSEAEAIASVAVAA
jgi:anti-sigma B factor antagonist